MNRRISWGRLAAWLAAALVLGGLVFGAVWVARHPGDWTGFGDYVDPQGGFTRGKTLWDWLQLAGALALPVFIAAATAVISYQQDRNRRLSEQAERDLNAERARESALQTYLDDMGDLMLERGLGRSVDPADSHAAHVRVLARVKTLTILRVLAGDTGRRTIVARFLNEAGLLRGEAGLDLAGADLSGINLAGAQADGAHLRGADLHGSALPRASLHGADLHEADLTGADLGGADLTGADLGKARAGGARLVGAGLQDASAQETVLDHADLRDANLRGAGLQQAVLDYADLHHATLHSAGLQRASLYNANLQGARLYRARLQGANLRWARFQGASLYRARLQSANLTNAAFDTRTTLPDKTRWEAAADMARFTDQTRPDFWHPDDVSRPDAEG